MKRAGKLDVRSRMSRLLWELAQAQRHDWRIRTAEGHALATALCELLKGGIERADAGRMSLRAVSDMVDGVTLAFEEFVYSAEISRCLSQGNRASAVWYMDYIARRRTEFGGARLEGFEIFGPVAPDGATDDEKADIAGRWERDRNAWKDGKGDRAGAVGGGAAGTAEDGPGKEEGRDA